MSASSALGDVTRTLEDLLTREQRPAGLFEVSLRSPADETVEPSMKPKINLYLFRVEENVNAKNRPWPVTGSESRRYPPLALDLFYVLTPYADRLVDEQTVLGEAMRVLYENTLVETEALRGSLRHSGEDLKIDLGRCDVENLTRIWNAFNQPYRLSVCYEVRAVLVDAAREVHTGRVTESVEDYEHLDGH